MRHVLFVVGMGRSGSSALARILSLCGAALPLEILPENYGNPTGYWEPERALRINDRFLARHSSSWYDVDPTLQIEPLATRERAAFVDEVAQFLAGGFCEGDTAVLKEPRISGLLPYWLAAAGALGLHAALIHIFRHPDEVAASLDARDGLPTEHAHALWLKYNLFAERDGRRVPRTFLGYDKLLEDWEEAIERCVRDLGLRESLRITPSARSAVADFLRPELRHHASLRSPLSDSASESRLRRTYGLLHDATVGHLRPADFNAVRTSYVSSRTAT